MNFTDALSKIGAAVGDGKIVWQHAYVKYTPTTLRATDGRQWATFLINENVVPFCVRYDALKAAMSRDGARAESIPHLGLKVTAGRSRTTIKGADINSWPERQFESPTHDAFVAPPPDFLAVLKDLAPFMGKPDNHIWQNGIHLTPDYAYAANPYAMARRKWEWPAGFTATLPAWSLDFLLKQDIAPERIMEPVGGFLRFVWPEYRLDSTLLVEEPSEAAQMLVGGLPTEGGVPVPDGLKDAVGRLAAFGAKTFQLGEGRLMYNSDLNREGVSEVFLEEDIDLDVPRRTWGVAHFQAALEHAETLDFSQFGRCVWHGGGYDGVFAGYGGNE